MISYILSKVMNLITLFLRKKIFFNSKLASDSSSLEIIWMFLII